MIEVTDVISKIKKIKKAIFMSEQPNSQSLKFTRVINCDKREHRQREWSEGRKNDRRG